MILTSLPPLKSPYRKTAWFADKIRLSSEAMSPVRLALPAVAAMMELFMAKESAIRSMLPAWTVVESIVMLLAAALR